MIREFELARPEWIHLVWGAVFVVLVALWSAAARRRALALFGLDLQRHGAWLRLLARRRLLRASLLALAVLAFTAAALEPRCNPEKRRVERRARDIAVVVDVSRSMLADDIKPNRLERAKLELERLADRLRGDRIGLIAFAGDAEIKCPLTANYTYFKSVVRNLSTRSASQGGTRIGDAVRKALRDLLGLDPAAVTEEKPQEGKTVLEDEGKVSEPSYADILLITDGEDHDSYPLKAAEQTRRVDVGLYIVGIGSEEGTPIPIRTETGALEYLRYKGQIVRSRLDSKTLMEMVQAAPRGAYLPAGTDNFDLVDFYEKTLGQEAGREVAEERVTWTEIYQPFTVAGLALFLASLLLPERPKGPRAPIYAESEETAGEKEVLEGVA